MINADNMRLAKNPFLSRFFTQPLVVGVLIGLSVFLSLNSIACLAGEPLQGSHVSALASFHFTPDGQLLVTTASDGEVLLWNVDSGELLRELLPVREFKGTIRCELHRARVLVYDNDGAGSTIQLLDLESGEVQQTLTPPKHVHMQPPQFSQDGRFVFATATKRGWQGLIRGDTETGDRTTLPKEPFPDPAIQVAELMKQFDPENTSKPTSRKPEVAEAILEGLVILKESLAEQGTLTGDSVMGGADARFSPNSQIVVCNYWGDTGSSEEEVTVWDFDSGQLLHSFYEPYFFLEHVLFSSDGQHFFVGHAQDKLEVRSCKTGKLIRELVHSGGKITAMARSPKEKWIAAGGSSGSVTVWNVRKGTAVQQLDSEGEVASIEFSPNGQWMVVARKEQSAVLYATKDWAPVCTVPEVFEVTKFSPDSRRLLMANNRRHSGMTHVVLFRVPSGKRIAAIAKLPSFNDLKICPNGDWCLGVPITPRHQNQLPLSIWNARTGKLLHQFDPSEFLLEHPRVWPQQLVKLQGLIQSTPISSAATLKSQASWGRRAFRPIRYEPHLRAETKQAIAQIDDFDQQGRQWLEGMLIEKTVDPKTAKQPRLLRKKPDGSLQSAQWGYSGQYVIAIRDESGKAVREFSVQGMVPKAAALSSDGRQIWIGYRSSKYKNRTQRLVQWKVETGQRIRTIDATPVDFNSIWKIEQLTLSPNEHYLAAGNIMYDLQNQTQDVVATPVQFSPDSKSVYCFGDNRTLWSLEKRKELTVFGSHNTVSSPMYSAEGRYLIVRSTSGEGTALWDAHTGEAVQEFRQELRFAFSPPGNRFVSWTQASRVASHLWSFENSRMLADLSTELGPGCLGVCFSPDGKLLMTWHCEPPALYKKVSSHRVAFWDAKTGKRNRYTFGSLLIDNLESQPFFVDNTHCITIHHDGAKLWDAQKGNLLHHYVADQHKYTHALLSPDKSKLLVVTPGKQGTLWDVDTGKQELQFAGLRGSVQFANGQQQLIEHCRSRQLVKVWDVQTGQIVREIHASGMGADLVIQ